MTSALRPRDIQARIRSGESPEMVAAAAQTTVERIMPFAAPVMAERAWVAQQAQHASVRRRAGEGGPIGNLGAAVAERLASRAVEPEEVAWDAWRREDGRWTLVADYRAGGEPTRATFTYDAPGRYVVAEDEESRWLVGERGRTPAYAAAPAAGPAAAAALTGATPLAAVEAGAGEDDDQLSLGDDAIELVTSRTWTGPGQQVDAAAAAGGDAAVEEDTVDLSDTAGRVAPVREPLADDWILTQATERPRAAATGHAPADPQPAPEPVREPAAEPADALFDAPLPTQPTAEGPVFKASRSRGRASVPSWDEIMFGGPKQE